MFANARWDEPADSRIAKISPYVAPTSLNLVLTQYQRVRPKEENQEVATYEVTATRWIIVGESQATLLVDGMRTVQTGGKSARTPLGLSITLSRATGKWQVTTARDPKEGDTGGR